MYCKHCQLYIILVYIVDSPIKTKLDRRCVKMELEMGLQSSLILKHKGETLYCGKFCPTKTGLFEEIHSFWASLSEDAATELFELYKEIIEVYVAEKDIPVQYLSDLLDQVHTEELIEQHCLNIEYPKNAKEEYISHKHYTMEETYTIPDYKGLAILSIRLRSLMPVLAAMELYIQHRSMSGGDIMYKTKSIIDKIAECEIYDCEAFERLRTYVMVTQSKMIGGEKGANITGSILEAFGSEDIPQYLLGTSVILGCIPTPINVPNTNVAKSINSKLKDELTKKITRRFNVVNERPFARMAMKEDNNIGYFETYRAREQVPSAIPLMMGVWGENYRQARKSLGIELSPSDIKDCINSVELNPYPQFTTVQQYIIKQTMMGIILHQTVVDIPASMLVNIIGVVQMYLIENKFFTLARLMSSHGELIGRDSKDIMFSKLNFNPLESDVVDWLNRYFKLSIPNPRGKQWVKGYDITIGIMTDNIERYTWKQTATAEVCKLLGSNNGRYIPDVDTANELGRLIATVNAREINKIKSKEGL